MKSSSMSLSFLSALFGVLVLTGCPPKNKMAIKEKPQDEKLVQNEVSKDTGISIGQEWTEIPSLTAVRFAFNSSALDQTARETLKKNIAVLKKLPATVKVRVEGHCDQRGTVEYNIALGQQRASAVKSYYSASGVAKNRIETISFGYEKPVCSENTEECWAKNRRGGTQVRNAQPIMVNAEEIE